VSQSKKDRCMGGDTTARGDEICLNLLGAGSKKKRDLKEVVLQSQALISLLQRKESFSTFITMEAVEGHKEQKGASQCKAKEVFGSERTLVGKEWKGPGKEYRCWGNGQSHHPFLGNRREEGVQRSLTPESVEAPNWGGGGGGVCRKGPGLSLLGWGVRR